MTKNLIVMYHYIRPKGKHRWIFPFEPRELKIQLKWLQGHYPIISMNEYVDYLINKKQLPKKTSVLTFDDGLKDHYSYVFPILKEIGVCGTFFVPTMPFESKVPSVQKIQYILDSKGPEWFAKEINHKLPPKSEHLIKTDSKKVYKKLDNILVSNIKTIVATMPEKLRNDIVNAIFSSIFKEKKFCEKVYLSKDEIKEMIEAGMNFGGHSHSHPFLDRCNIKRQNSEISKPKKFFKHAFNYDLRLYSYPYGKFNQDTFLCLKENDYDCAVIDPSVEIGYNLGKPNPYCLKRFDCIDLFPRKELK